MSNLSHYQPIVLEVVEAARARAGLTLLKPEIDDSDIITFAPAKDFALTSEILAGLTDDVNATLCSAGVTDELRAYVDAIIGLSGGSDDWFEANDFEVGKRLGHDKASEASIEKRTQRARSAFNAWQKANKITLIEAMPGGKDADGGLHPTRYRCRIASLAIHARELAQTRPGYDRNPYKLTTEAAAELLAKLEYTEPDKRRFRKPRPDALSKNARLLLTIGNKIAKLSLIEGGGKFETERKELAKRSAALVESFQPELTAIVAGYDRLEGRRPCGSSPHSYMSFSGLDRAETGKAHSGGDSNPAGLDDQNKVDNKVDKPVQPLQAKNLQETPFLEDSEPDEPSFEASDNAIGGGAEVLRSALSEEPQEARVSVVPNEPLELEELSDEGNEGRIKDARRGLEAFRSVGQRNVGLRIGGNETLAWEVLPIEEAILSIAEWIRKADEARESLAIRPTAADKFQTKMTPEEIRADDAAVYARIIEPDIDKGETAEKYRLVRPLLCYGSATSPGHFQGAVAVRCDKPTFEKLRRRLIAGVDTDTGATGSFRLVGSKNYKPGRNGIVIELLDVAPGRVWTPEDLEAGGLLAPPAPEPTKSPRPISSSRPGRFPDFSRFNNPDRDKRDHAAACMALEWGHEVEAVIDWLMAERIAADGGRTTQDESKKKSKSYYQRTVAKAYAKVSAGGIGGDR